ncbi:hypothetical protein IG193_04650 [Infirmifilum lucidum]|uniref:Uncharacterized protein n=1 Tax=Infirmifilum lucidum TaxID=2776706 RepID=A0A7L9FEH0_9CREN|nr:hypothetical protein [Infirmifilum lucidum]QOJ78087.1 hypothetical protein IG193_04650 [Infirmifilum lucidum]
MKKSLRNSLNEFSRDRTLKKIRIKIELPVSPEAFKALVVDDFSTVQLEINAGYHEGRIVYTITLDPRKTGEAKGIVNEVLRILKSIENLKPLADS